MLVRGLEGTYLHRTRTHSFVLGDLLDAIFRINNSHGVCQQLTKAFISRTPCEQALIKHARHFPLSLTFSDGSSA